MRRYNITLLVSLLAFFWSAISYAVQVNIDTFSIYQNGSPVLIDTFSDGVAPPSGPTGATDIPSASPPSNTYYAVSSTNPLNAFPSGAESGGKLQMDSANGVLSQNASGGARLSLSVTPKVTSLAPFTFGSGSLLMTGVFTLPPISGLLGNQGYGIRFIDNPGCPTCSNKEILELNVQYWTGNASNPKGWYIRYLVQDFVHDTINTIGAVAISLPQSNEICLAISRADNSTQFDAGYAYVSGGNCDNQIFTDLGPATGFLYTQISPSGTTLDPVVRGQFHAFETVPEPGTWLLVGVGLLGLGLVARRRGKIYN